jgi:hypothetical protein
VTFAEDSALEINAGSQRQYLGQRAAYLSDELIFSVDRHLSLVDGSLTWLMTTDLVRCLLRTSAYALLSSHYGVLYGGATGWDQLPVAQHWENGAVSSWLPEGWVENGKDLPDATLAAGYERPPKWQGDYCSPFTFSYSHFVKAKATPGSIGRYEPQDNIYFTENCFSDISDKTGLEVAFFQRNPRLRLFIADMKPHECYGYRDDIILCAPDGEEEADRRWPLDLALKAAIEELVDTNAVATCDPEMTLGCKEAKRRRKCAESVNTEADFRYMSNDQCTAWTQDEAKKKGYQPEGLHAILATHRRRAGATGSSEDHSIRSRLGKPKVHDLKRGIGDANYYKKNYQSDVMQGSKKPVDTAVRQGLHNFITFITDHAISLSNERAGDLRESNKHYSSLHKYVEEEFDSGKEWLDALTKSILISVHETVTKLHSNNTSTTAAYIVMLVVLILQFFMLGSRIEVLMEDNAGMVTLVRRLMMEAGRLSIKLDAVADSKGQLEDVESAGSSTSPSDGSGSSDGESDEENSEMDKELLGSSESEGSSLG